MFELILKKEYILLDKRFEVLGSNPPAFADAHRCQRAPEHQIVGAAAADMQAICHLRRG